jgi:hypothetical protein
MAAEGGIMRTMAMLAATVYVVLTVTTARSQTIYSIEATPTGGTTSVEIKWLSNPLDQYDVKTRPSLAAGAWTSATPESVTASNLTMGISLAVTNQTQFFKVNRKDVEPPAITPLSPQSNAVAVPRMSTIALQITDGTGVDTNSLALSVNGTNYTLSSSALSFTGGDLVYSNAPNALGDFGQTVQVTVVAADLHGYAASNTYAFRLELAPESASNVLVVGSGGTQPLPKGVRTLDSSSLQLVDTYTNRLVFTYTGSHGLTVGQLLASSVATNIFYRRITSLDDDPGNGLVTAWTSDARLEDFFQQGSFQQSQFTLARPSGPQALGLPVQWDALQVHQSGDVPFAFGGGGISVSGNMGSWQLDANVAVAAEIVLSGLKTCDIDVNGSVAVDLTPEFLVSLAEATNAEVALIDPVHKIYGTTVAGIPVWVDLVFEINAGAEMAAEATGRLEGGVQINRDISYSVTLRDGSWTNAAPDTGWVVEPVPLVYEIQGDATARVYLQPKITVYVVSLVGAYAGVEPWLSFTGNYQNSPLQYRYDVSAGLDFILGLDVRFWNDNWGTLPSWTFTALSKPIWMTEYPLASPRITSPPVDLIRESGETAVFTVAAEGDPAPTFQWYQNNAILQGRTAPSLIFRVTPQCAGTYKLQVTNSHGSTSATATLTVGDAIGGMVAYYPFNGNPNDTTGNGHNGTAVGAIVCNDRFGNSARAYRFDGQNDYISVADAGSLQLAGSFTIGAWINANSLRIGASREGGTLVRKGRSWHQNYNFLLDGDGKLKLHFETIGNNNFDLSGQTTLQLHSWYHAVCVYDVVGNTMRIYLNGRVDGAAFATGTPLTSADHLTIGVEDTVEIGYTRWMDGDIDDVRIYNRALSGEEVMALYIQTRP